MGLVIDTAGILFLWLSGLVVAFYAPFFALMAFMRNGEGLSAIVVGFFWGRIFAVVYVLASIAYLAVT